MRERLRVHWFDDWHDDLDAALGHLPEMDTCPTPLYRELILRRSTVEKRTALVTRGGDPVAVVGLRRDADHWVPVTSWVVPGVVFPVVENQLVPVLMALREPVIVTWWRQPEPPPTHDRIEVLETVATRRIECRGDHETHWVKSKLMKSVRRARRRCEHMNVEVNRPGAAEWTIRNWGRRWAPPGMEILPDTADRVAVAEYWEPRGRHFVISLVDGDRIIASAIVFAHGNHVVGMAFHRESSFDHLQVSTRLIDAVHQWASETGFEKLDIGGGHDYKRRWAPEEGEHHQFMVSTRLRRLEAALRGALSRLTASGTAD